MSNDGGFPDNWDESDVKAMAASILSLWTLYDIACKLNYIVTIRFFVGGKLK